ncbi:MAG: chlorhexidine efflux transporter [Psychrobacter sp.]
MRTTRDRIRHTLGFEVIGLIIFIPLASSVSGFDSQLVGSMAVVGSITVRI